MQRIHAVHQRLSTIWACHKKRRGARVSDVDFRSQEAAIHFQVVCDAQRLPCPACAAPDQRIHDRIARTWQHRHFFQFRAHIHAELPRVACSAYGKTSQIEVPWSRKGSGFSLTMEAFIVALCREVLVLFATPGRDGQTFAAFVQDLASHGGDPQAIETVSMDMSKAYQAGARQHCPQAALSFDPFHVVALAHDALEEVRRAETKTNPELKGSCWATLKDARHWTLGQLTVMHHLQRSSLKTARAWRLKEALARRVRAGT